MPAATADRRAGDEFGAPEPSCWNRSRTTHDIRGGTHGPAEDLSMSLVRRQRGGGSDLLHLTAAGQPRRQGVAIARRDAEWPGRHGADRRLHARRRAVPGPQRRPGLQLQRGDLVRDRVRGPGRGRSAVGRTDCRWWRARTLRLAQGSLRRLVADRAEGPERDDGRSRHRGRAARDGGDAPDGQARRRRAAPRVRGQRGTTAGQRLLRGAPAMRSPRRSHDPWHPPRR